MSSSLPKFVSLDATEVEVEKQGLEGIASVECYSAKQQSDIPVSVEEADVVAVWHTIWLDEPLLQRLKNAKMIVRMGVGYDNVDIQAAGKLGIPVCNIPDYGTEEVADHAICLILSLYRKIHVLASRVEAGEVIQGPDGIAAASNGVIRVRGQVLGIIGLGRIGSATAVRAKAFGLDVVFFDPFLPDGADKALGIRRAESLAELLAQANCISLHCNATEENEKFINSRTLQQVQKGVFLVNTARGELVDEDALAQALESGQVGAAALDVHWGEPFIKGKGALGNAPNLMCTPHSAWYSSESRLEMRQKGVATAKRAFAGEPLRNVVNKEFLVGARLST